MVSLLKNEIQYLQGVGPKRAVLLNKELHIYTTGDLLYYFPYKHIDRTRYYKISEINADLPYIQVIGQIMRTEITGGGNKKRLVAFLSDETGILEMVWFKGLKWIRDSLKPGVQYLVFGRPTLFNNKINLVHPEIEELSKVEKNINASLQGFYNTSEKLKNSFITSRVIQKLVMQVMKSVYGKLPETFPDWLIERMNFPSINDALLHIHFPSDPESLRKAEYRLKFEELFYIQLAILKLKAQREQSVKGYVFTTVGELFNTFYQKNLPFELTEAQKRVIREIRKDLGSGKQMNRLLQGDVGSGKTLVALMCMLIALDNGYQSCIMAPTEILANQHFETIREFLNGLPVTVELLTGSTKKAHRNFIQKELQENRLNILIGTHALIEETVQFRNLGFVVIDEQHKFGVAQRAKLWQKSKQPPHIMVMTATPIPRTLAMTIYGDLDISVIDELPPGRKPVKTIHFHENQRLKLNGFIAKQIEEGRQIYIVYPLIKESEKMDYLALEEGYHHVVEAFPPPKYAVSIVHGKLKNEEKEFAMRLFVEGKTHIMVATTVIEVGVNIPNASVMVIESAEKFGLSQLHQLRGRVGRGADQSYCILMTSYKMTQEARRRMETMVRTTDGFEIAEVDMQLRGPGDIEGTQQSGVPFDLRIANLAKDGQLLQLARDKAANLLEQDPDLEKTENAIISKQLALKRQQQEDWAKIS
jgi:ATP-dependent DNA helicase RecG